ncbi:four-helix bundle copper-binding protein [Neisseria bacilliformis]|uniref:four-helix bundle copper-binding protein n=1 Tax=Neisseria bacilliformis TaxID=267212 RepID=UPI0028E92995|nr:four-helix bundle copper-binding protein [Neisseria bacilliformis]
MNRRQFIGSTAAVSLAAAASLAKAHDHAGHSHAAPATVNSYEAARAAAGHCVAAGQVCLAHCIALLNKGDTSMKDCSVAANQMLALCGALQNLAAQRSRLTPALAKVCAEACKQCAAACKEHAAHHAECKACYESCTACAKACEAIAA